MPPAPSARPDRLLRGVVLRLGAVCLFAIMSAAIKLAHDWGVSTPETAFYRSLFGLAPILIWIGASGAWSAWRTRRPLAHLGRGAIGLTTMMLTFGALALLPLAEATTISFAAPLFATILAALWLREAVGPYRWTAVVVGFLGVLIVVRPGGASLPSLGLAVAVLGAFGAACVNTSLREIGRTDAVQTTVLWFTVFGTVVTGLAMPVFGQAHGPATWALLIGLGLLGGTGQICLTASLRFAPIALVAPLDYIQLLFAVALGWAIWSVQPAPSTWIGAAVIIGSVLYTLHRERRRGRLRSAASELEPI